MSKKYLVSILLVTGVVAGSASAQSLVPLDPATITDGHVYLLDDASGTDSSAVGLTGTAVGAPQPAEGLSGAALQFDGVADGIDIPDSQFINTPGGPFGNRTLVAVFNCDDVDKPGKQTIFEEGGTTRGSIFYVSEGLLYAAAWNRAEYNWNGEWPSTPIGSGEWHAVAMVIRDGGEAVEDDKFEMWLDGQLIAKLPGGHLHDHGDNNAIGYTRQNTVFHDGNASPANGHYFGGIIDEVWILNVSLSVAELQTIGPNRTGAKNPTPANDGTDILRDGTLSWEPGIFAQRHNVYLGTGLDDVNNATVADPLDVLLSEAQDTTSIDPGRLAFDQTYYWRVDEVNGAPDFTVYKGDVWNFTIEPLALPVTDITATATSEFGVSTADRTIDGSGLTGDGHGAAANDMWISTGIPASIAWAFDRAYKLHEMWVWNSNQFIEPFIGFGAKDVVIEHSLDGENWTVLEGVSALAQAPGAEGYAANSIIDFGGAKAQHVRMTINTVHGFAPQASLSEVRFLYIPTFATGPTPLSGATDVAADVTLSWDRDGREAGRHDIYLGFDPNALSLAGTVQESSFETLATDLQVGQTYYWQVVEVNDTMDPMEWAGDIWSFTTVGTIAIDDMESYRDEEFLEIWATWMDGFENPANNGSLVGGVAGTPETGRIYGGGQSLPMLYDNSAAAQSEATRTFDAAMNWTKHGVQSLVLFFGGSPGSTGGQLYLKVNDTKIAYDGSSSDLMHLGWNRWTIPLSSFSASTLSRVSSMTIGIEGNGSGVVYVDEIQLTEDDARVVVTPTEPSAEALVAHYAFDGDASDSTGQSPGTLFGLTSFVPGVDGQALFLDGVNAYVAIDGLFYDSNGLMGVTVMAWIRTGIEDNQIIASFDRNEYWRLEINGDGGGPGQVGWDVWTDTGQLDYGSSSRVDDNEWHHVAGVFDNGTSTIYIDGYHEAPATGGSTFGTGNTRFGYVGLGSESTTFNAAPRTPASFFEGDVDDVRIYQRALSAAEVAGMAGRTEPFEQP